MWTKKWWILMKEKWSWNEQNQPEEDQKIEQKSQTNSLFHAIDDKVCPNGLSPNFNETKDFFYGSVCSLWGYYVWNVIALAVFFSLLLLFGTILFNAPCNYFTLACCYFRLDLRVIAIRPYKKYILFILQQKKSFFGS